MDVGRRSDRCVAGLPPAVCCVGRPWDAPGLVGQVMIWGEPVPQAIIDEAAEQGLEPHALAHHVEGVHGWESHDAGYGEAVKAAARCLLDGGCE